MNGASPNPYASPAHLFFERSRSSWRWATLLALCWSGCGVYYAFDILAALKKEVSHRLDIDNTQFNLLYGVTSFPVVVVCWAAGFFVDRLGRSGMLLTFSALLTGATSLFAVSIQLRRYWMAVLARALMGTAANCLWVAQSKILALWFAAPALTSAHRPNTPNAGAKQMALATGVLFSFFRLSTAANDYATPVIHRHWSLDGAVWMGVIACGVSFLAACVLVALERWADAQERELDDPLLSPLQNPAAAGPGSPAPRTPGIQQHGMGGVGARNDDNAVELSAVCSFPLSFWLLCVLSFLLYASVMSFNNICGDYLQDKYGYSVEEADRIMGIPFFLSAATFPFVGWVVDRIGKRPFLLLVSAAYITAAHAVFLETSLAPYLSVCLLGMAYVLYATALWPSIPFLIPQHVLGTAFGLVTCAFNLGLAVTPLVVGHLRDHYGGYHYVEVLFACLGIAAVGLSLVLMLVDWRSGGSLSRRRGAAMSSRSVGPATPANHDRGHYYPPHPGFGGGDGAGANGHANGFGSHVVDRSYVVDPAYDHMDGDAGTIPRDGAGRGSSSGYDDAPHPQYGGAGATVQSVEGIDVIDDDDDPSAAAHAYAYAQSQRQQQLQQQQQQQPHVVVGSHGVAVAGGALAPGAVVVDRHRAASVDSG